MLFEFQADDGLVQADVVHNRTKCVVGIFAAGCVFVFVLSIGNFITPDLLGGGRRIVVGNLIYDQFLSARAWPFGASLAFLLIGIMLTLLFIQAWLVNRSARRGVDV